MTRYKQQTDMDDDASSVGSARTEDLPTGTTTIRYHMGSHFWRSRSPLEKALLVGWLLLLLVVAVLVAILHAQSRSRPAIHMFVNHSTLGPQVADAPPAQTAPTTSSPTVTAEKEPTKLLGSPCLDPTCVMLAGSILNNMDLTADPCRDFYKYACGGWVAKNPIPEGRAMWGTLSKLASDNQLIMKNELESEEIPKSKAEEKAKVFYRSCIDPNKTIEDLGAQPLVKLLQEIGGWSLSNWTVPANFNIGAEIQKSKVDFMSSALFTWGVSEDDKNSTRHTLQFDQGGLVLPTRNFYLNETEKTVLDAYIEFITKVGMLLKGEENRTREWARVIVDVEKRLAEITTPDDERRDDEKLYHLMSLEQLTDTAPFLDWTKFVNAALVKVKKQMTPKDTVVVYAPDYLRNLNTVLLNLTSTDEGIIAFHDYLVWHVVKNYIGYLSRDFRDAAKILEKAQMGVEGSEEPWRYCVSATDAAMGPAVGAMYVRKAFQGNSKNVTESMIQGVRKAFRESIMNLDWMDNKTRQAAIGKADAITEMIGFPEYILDEDQLNDKFHGLKVNERQFFENNQRVLEYKVKESFELLFKPVNKSRWDMSAPTVNAYYTPTKNEIVFPAGILQAPFFHIDYPRSLNYGAVGVVMGHELAHAFDDQGRKYNKDGNLHQWWEQKTIDRFKLKTACMVEQYSQYSLNGEKLNGKLTLGENIADNGGLKASYRAYEEWEKSNGVEEPLPGLNLTSRQLFFLGFSQVWCSSMSKEAAHLEIAKDSHVPAEFRVLGTLSNFEDFSNVFHCPKGSQMNPAKKCEVW
ncbi:M13 family metallopeptidase neprilysin 3 isoform X2 [Oratosquilla oratoria]